MDSFVVYFTHLGKIKASLTSLGSSLDSSPINMIYICMGSILITLWVLDGYIWVLDGYILDKTFILYIYEEKTHKENYIYISFILHTNFFINFVKIDSI